MLDKQVKKNRRHRRVRAKIIGTAKLPRLCVFRSAKHIYAQLIDDDTGTTIASVNDSKLKLKGIVAASEVGKMIAISAKEKSIKMIVFDRGGYKYHGRVQALANGAREGGLKF